MTDAELDYTFNFIKAYEAELAPGVTCKAAYEVVADRYYAHHGKDKYTSYETFKRILSYHRNNNRAKLHAWKG